MEPVNRVDLSTHDQEAYVAAVAGGMMLIVGEGGQDRLTWLDREQVFKLWDWMTQEFG